MSNPHIAAAMYDNIPASVARAHDELLTHVDVQFDFPKYEPPQTPQWLVALAKFLEPVWPFLKYAIWATLVVGAAVVLYLIVREILRRGWNRRVRLSEPVTTMAEWQLSPNIAHNLLLDADGLAAQGKYADAIHLLLLRSIEHIDKQKPNLVKPALTSREIATLGQLPNAARATFADLARVVEYALFADRDVDASDFARCRETYKHFAFPAIWAAPVS